MSRLREEFQVTPRAVLLVAVLVAGAVTTLIFTLVEETPFVRIAIGGVAASVLCLYILLVGYVYADSKRRGMRHVLWTLIAVFVPYAIGLMAYFLLREPVLTPCGRCGTPARREFAFCPDCGATLRRACPECHQPVEPFWSHCAHCGLTLSLEPSAGAEREQPASAEAGTATPHEDVSGEGESDSGSESEETASPGES